VEEDSSTHKQLSRLAEEMSRLRERERGMGNTSAPGGSIPPDAQSSVAASASSSHGPTLQDRGLFHASEAMRSMYEMGDAPSCSTCGAIMVRNGSCYRCMSCGSTSGCS
jgi:ribonucleoside-diphosphate reductase alpha chain